MIFAPIILFVYNRPEHTKKTIEALRLNELASDSLLFVFSDGPKDESDNLKINQVREYISSISGFKNIQVTRRDKNLGLANSVTLGVTDIINEYGKAIILEDDIVTSKYFLKFMNEALDFYENEKRIYSISGYNFPIRIPKSYSHQIYISLRPSSWGWATWKDRWEKVDWEILDYNDFINNEKEKSAFSKGGEDLVKMLKHQMEGKINSWAVRWAYYHFKNNAFCLFPNNSLLRNIGADASGTHMRRTKKFNVDIQSIQYKNYLVKNIQPDERILKEVRKFFSKKNIFKRIFNLFQ